jgi:hypothetical protein
LLLTILLRALGSRLLKRSSQEKSLFGLKFPRHPTPRQNATLFWLFPDRTSLLRALFIAWLFLSALVAQNALVRRSGSGFWHGLWHALLPAMFTALILRAFQIIFLGHNDQTLLSLNARGVNAVHGDPVPPKQMQKKAPPYGIAQAGSLRKFLGKNTSV